jgi:hypothetical protein
MSRLGLFGLPSLSVCALVWSAVCIAAAPAASAQEKPPSSELTGAWAPSRLRYDAHAALSWDGDLGAGGRVDISVFDRTRLYDTHDELSVSVGGDVMFLTLGGSNRVTVYPTATVQWSLGASEKLALSPELGLVGQIKDSGWGGIYPNIGFGGRYYIHKSVSLNARLGWPVALSFGATF